MLGGSQPVATSPCHSFRKDVLRELVAAGKSISDPLPTQSGLTRGQLVGWGLDPAAGRPPRSASPAVPGSRYLHTALRSVSFHLSGFPSGCGVAASSSQ